MARHYGRAAAVALPSRWRRAGPRGAGRTTNTYAVAPGASRDRAGRGVGGPGLGARRPHGS
ncbi:MAG TPA: hypothetical protein VF230_01235, partial [Acidimicrobiales bacterium]